MKDINYIIGYVEGLLEGCSNPKMKSGLEKLLELLKETNTEPKKMNVTTK